MSVQTVQNAIQLNEARRSAALMPMVISLRLGSQIRMVAG